MDILTASVRPRITIVEGPAGSGKSTYIKSLGPDIHRVGNYRLPRDGSTSPYVMAALSIGNDVMKVSEALAAHYETGASHIVIDRLIFSQYVYGRLRGGMGLVPPTARSVTQFFRDVSNLFFQRTGAYPGQLHIECAFILPSVAIIEERRLKAAPRHFGFSASEEHVLYNQIIEQFRLSINPHHDSISLTFPDTTPVL